MLQPPAAAHLQLGRNSHQKQCRNAAQTGTAQAHQRNLQPESVHAQDLVIVAPGGVVDHAVHQRDHPDHQQHRTHDRQTQIQVQGDPVQSAGLNALGLGTLARRQRQPQHRHQQHNAAPDGQRAEVLAVFCQLDGDEFLRKGLIDHARHLFGGHADLHIVAFIAGVLHPVDGVVGTVGLRVVVALPGDILPVDGGVLADHIIFYGGDSLSQRRQGRSHQVRIDHALGRGGELAEVGIIGRLGHFRDGAPADIIQLLPVPVPLKASRAVALQDRFIPGIPDHIVKIVLQIVDGIHIGPPAEESLKELRLDARAVPGVAVKDRIGGPPAEVVYIGIELAPADVVIVAQVAHDQSHSAQHQHSAGNGRQHQGQQLEQPVIAIFHLIASIL